jgi:hypothetical protein
LPLCCSSPPFPALRSAKVVVMVAADMAAADMAAADMGAVTAALTSSHMVAVISVADTAGVVSAADTMAAAPDWQPRMAPFTAVRLHIVAG